LVVPLVVLMLGMAPAVYDWSVAPATEIAFHVTSHTHTHPSPLP
jgi:hypothetical protein